MKDFIVWSYIYLLASIGVFSISRVVWDLTVGGRGPTEVYQAIKRKDVFTYELPRRKP